MNLGVNIDHVATLRQARRIDVPDPVVAVAPVPPRAIASVPVLIFVALIAVIPEPAPASDVAVSNPLDELNVKLLPLFAGKLPLAVVTKSGKQVVSADSS